MGIGADPQACSPMLKKLEKQIDEAVRAARCAASAHQLLINMTRSASSHLPHDLASIMCGMDDPALRAQRSAPKGVPESSATHSAQEYLASA